ncbi:NAD(P)H-hydrate dehydratase [Brucella sp. BE17]|uniref:NAD(P)H-hydrate dehydratase n=1 Tax=Brucella sp. BE17 TaxID=3142977 RepID=UPI0031BA1149
MFELLSPDEMGDADRWTIESGIRDGFSLMLAAGKSVADVAGGMFSREMPVAVLCGPGNNGGDGYVAAQYLLEAGFEVVCFCSTLPRNGSDALRASVFYKGDVRGIAQFSPASFGGVVDALYGAGLTREIHGAEAIAIAALNGSGLPVVAVDLPSGVSGESGQAQGVVVTATTTVTFFRKKPGHLLQPGRALCGVLHVTDIGISDTVLSKAIKPQTFENAPELWSQNLPVLSVDAHKYSRGHVAVFSGPMHSTGAARLSALAAARSGAGAVTLLSPTDAMTTNAAHLTSIMVRESNTADDAERFILDRKVAAAVLGPGFGNRALARDYTQMLSGSDATTAFKGLVLDADAIVAFEDNPQQLFDIRKNAKTDLIMTPHEGEFRRLFPDIAAHDTSKLDKARMAAKRANAVIVYKGPDTVIAAPDARAAINTNGTPLLATAGSGDVLAGIICGLLAQTMPAFEAACAAVWVHGDTARRFGHGLIAEDLPQLLPNTWSVLAKRE